MSEERRREDQRIDDMHSDIKEILRVLNGEQGICVRMGQAETRINSMQAELTEHKENKFRVMDIVLGGLMALLAIFDLWKK